MKGDFRRPIGWVAAVATCFFLAWFKWNSGISVTGVTEPPGRTQPIPRHQAENSLAVATPAPNKLTVSGLGLTADSASSDKDVVSIPNELSGLFLSGDAAYLYSDPKIALSGCDKRCFEVISEESRRWVTTSSVKAAEHLLVWLSNSGRAEALAVSIALMSQLERLQANDGGAEVSAIIKPLEIILSNATFEFSRDSALYAIASITGLSESALLVLQKQTERSEVLQQALREHLVQAQGTGEAERLVDFLTTDQQWTMLSDPDIQANKDAFAALANKNVQGPTDAWLPGMFLLSEGHASPVVANFIKHWSMSQLSGERLEQLERHLLDRSLSYRDIQLATTLLAYAEDHQAASVIAARYGLLACRSEAPFC